MLLETVEMKVCYGGAIAVKDLSMDWVGGTLVVWLYPPHGNEIERWAGQKKSRFFQEVFGVEVRVLPAHE